MPATSRQRPPVARSLTQYQAMRDFSRTSEPSGAPQPRTDGLPGFVVQKHAARSLHYDFRLELDGVLLSWSVPRGPSLAPGDRRLAVRTEDHPIDYADFEGVIPAGEYGGGAVVVWDRGSWTADGDPRDGLRRGRLTFALAGEKLRGRWHLVRTRAEGKAEHWLLFKGRDEAASHDTDIIAARPESVITGRTVEEVAQTADRVWHSNRAARTPAKRTAKPRARAAATAKAPLAASSPSAAAESAKSASSDQLTALVRGLPLPFPLTNLDKVLYPDQGLTKAALVAYLAVVADKLLAHVAGRPLTLVRCPNGVGKECWYQKHAGKGVPASVGQIEIPEDDGVGPYMRVDDLAGLVALAQLGSLEIHAWGCRADKLERPDRLVMDLDPDPALPWARVVEAALELRARLQELGLETFVTTTGGKGVHVVAPLARRTGWDEHKAFAKAIADRMTADAPDRFTANPLKARRAGRIFVDYLRNARGATFITPYSPRRRSGAPVATPIDWAELPAVVPAALTVTTVPARLDARGGDPWADIGAARQAITAAAWRKLGGRPA